MSFREHLSGLFVAGVYYWLQDDELGANTCWHTALILLGCPTPNVMVS